MLAPVLVASILYAGSLALYLALQTRSASALAAAFKDDSVQICLWRAADGCYGDRDGTPVRLPRAGESMAVTMLDSEGERLAAIVHDSILTEDARFIPAIATAAMVGIEKTKLQADLRLSRRRFVGAADATRERLERDLHDGAQQRFVAVRLRLALAADAIDAGSNDAAAMVRHIGVQVEAALEELRQLGRACRRPYSPGTDSNQRSPPPRSRWPERCWWWRSFWLFPALR